MWEKIKTFFSNMWAFIRKYSVAFSLAIGSIGGYLFATRRASSDFERLRDDNNELIKQVAGLRIRLESITNVNESNKHELVQLGAELFQAQQYIDHERGRIEQDGSDVKSLEQTNRQLKDWIQQYGDKIKAVQDIRDG